MKVDLLAGAATARIANVPDRAARIVVFDSGLGGLTVHAEIARLMPSADVLYVGDTAVFPYGRLAEDALIARVVEVVAEAIRLHEPDIVVIACNTASTLALPVLRSRFPIQFVGTVPAIKPAAAQSLSGRVSVLATPGTVARDYTRGLIEQHASSCRVTLVGSPRLASLAEAALGGIPAADEAVLDEIRPAFVDEGGARTDVVVLACTHYPLLLPQLMRLAPWPVTWIDSANAIARRVISLAGERQGLPPVPSQAVFTGIAPVSAPLSAALAERGFSRIGRIAVEGR